MTTFGNNLLDSQDEPEHSGSETSYTAQAMSQFFPSQYKGGRRVVIVLTTDRDESMKDPDVTVVAGWVSDEQRWAAFSTLWQKALDEWNLDYFHMTDFDSPYTSPYKDWSPKQRQDRLNHLLTLIKDHVVVGVSASIPRDLYEAAIPDELKAKINPYHIAALACFLGVAGVLRHEIPQEVLSAFVYEKRGKGVGPVLDAYLGIDNDPKLKSELRVVTLSYQPKQATAGEPAFLPLQAADILAHETMKDVTNRRAGSPRQRRYPIAQLMASTDIRKAEFGLENLRQLVPQLGQIFV